MTDLRGSTTPVTGDIVARRYRLLERIGEGGMARVFRAHDTYLDRPVAIKIMRGPVHDALTADRVRAETTSLASLNHHSLVTLFDAHIDDEGISYLVMEYVSGITLRDLISEGPVAPVVLAGIATDLAEALYVAHEAGIVHRDLKPSNVLLWRSPVPSRDWRAKLADFGIAHLLDAEEAVAGPVMGTAAYIAPEQARGAPPAPPADIYAFGLLLIEALTGVRPYGDVEGVGAVVARMTSAPDIPRTLDAGWRRLLRRMTSLRPEERPSALEVAVIAAGYAQAAQPAPILDESTAPVDVAELDAAPVPARPVTDQIPVTLVGAAAAAAAAPAAASVQTGTNPAAKHHGDRQIGRLVWVTIAGIAALLIAVVTVLWAASLPEPGVWDGDDAPVTVGGGEGPPHSVSVTAEVPVDDGR